MTEIAAPVIVVERDLLFVSKIREPLKSAGQPCIVAKSAGDVQAYLLQTPLPAAIVIRFGIDGVDWQQIIKDAHTAGVPVLAYGSHVDVAAQQAARAAGATRVIANSKLAGNVLGQIQQTIDRIASTASNDDD